VYRRSAGALGMMGDAHNGDVEAVGHLANRFESASYGGVVVAIDTHAEVAANRGCTSPAARIFCSSRSRSAGRLKARRPASSLTALTIDTRSRSASAAFRRGTSVSAAPSSAARMMTLPFGAPPSRHGHEPPVVTAAAIASDT